MSFIINPFVFAAAGGGSSLPASDNFNRSNSTTGAGACSDSVHTWVDLIGTSGISSNQFYIPTLSSSRGLSVIDIGAVAATHQVTLVNNLSVVFNSGIAFRVQDANNFLLAYSYWNGDSVKFFKRVSGTFTELNAQGYTIANNDVLKVIDDGSNITIQINGSTKISTTSSLFTTTTKCGIYVENAASLFDTYSVV